jgi:transposase
VLPSRSKIIESSAEIPALIGLATELQCVSFCGFPWAELCRFTANGVLEIDNNIAERTMRPCAIGRKNWRFVGSDRGGETAATCFSILAGAKRHLIEPFAYVRDLLVAISTGGPDWNALLPDVWIAAHPEHFLQYRRDEAEAVARSRRRRRAGRREQARRSRPISLSRH